MSEVIDFSLDAVSSGYVAPYIYLALYLLNFSKFPPPTLFISTHKGGLSPINTLKPIFKRLKIEI